jgi:hypothetical protein
MHANFLSQSVKLRGGKSGEDKVDHCLLVSILHTRRAGRSGRLRTFPSVIIYKFLLKYITVVTSLAVVMSQLSTTSDS